MNSKPFKTMSNFTGNSNTGNTRVTSKSYSWSMLLLKDLLRCLRNRRFVLVNIDAVLWTTACTKTSFENFTARLNVSSLALQFPSRWSPTFNLHKSSYNLYIISSSRIWQTLLFWPCHLLRFTTHVKMIIKKERKTTCGVIWRPLVRFLVIG